MDGNVTLGHFKRAALDIGAHGDNDTLPFDIDNRFIKENYEDLAKLAYQHYLRLEKQGNKAAARSFDELQIFSERLLVPTGPAGFRITTKLHPFWNIYLNGLGVAIAEKFEKQRSQNAHSYRYMEKGDRLFDKDRSWRAYREATLIDAKLDDGAVVIQTDVSSFYEHIYHHKLENCIRDLFPEESTIATQVDRLLNNFSSGRSFGLPVGGQGARILAELMMSPIDQMLSEESVEAHRYVDDYTLITKSQEDAYRALSVLSHALANYGLSLNRSKTTILKAKHYRDYVNTQLGGNEDDAQALREIDLHFDPYSDSATADYSELKQTVQNLDIQTLLDLELKKSQPDTFLVAQIGRTLKYQSPLIAIQLCQTLLHSKNLNAFRASWSTIMRGLAAVRAENDHSSIFDELDVMLDEVTEYSPHLLLPEANCLHYLKTIRFKKTTVRARFVLELYNKTKSETVRRGCIECWKGWHDRTRFNDLRNKWDTLSVQEQRMLWLAAGDFGDEGIHFKKRVKNSLPNVWKIGIEKNNSNSFEALYRDWVENSV